MHIDFLQLCRDYAIDHQEVVDGWINITCPYHDNGDRGYKGGLNIQGGYFNCWVCGGHNLNSVLSEILGISYHEVTPILEQYSNQVSIRKKLNKRTTSSKVILPIEGLNNRCRHYLIKRNYDPDYLLEKYKLCGSTLTGPWAGRLIIPVYYKNKLVSFQGRSLLSKRRCKELGILRYKTLNIEKSVIDPKHMLYNLDNCKNDFIVITEGAPDVWRFGDNSTATLGTSTTPEQKKLILKYDRIILLFDPEKEAQERAFKLGNELASFNKKVEIVDTELLTDPGDMSENEILKLKRILKI